MREVVIMAAPNGARKTKNDHPALPVSISDTVSEAAACYAAGASALHAHLRGSEDQHLLDAGLYRELLDEMSLRVPGMLVQVTSEAVGIYTPEQQLACIEALRPRMASMVLREISSNFTRPDYARRFFEWCVEHDVHIQHIVFSEEELRHLLEYREAAVIPANQRCLMLVLGRYRADFQSRVSDLDPFLQHDLSAFDWFVCAFGRLEEQCALAAIDAGGHARVGFENNLYLPDGEIAAGSSALVASLVEALGARDCRPAGSERARQLLGVRRA